MQRKVVQMNDMRVNVAAGIVVAVAGAALVRSLKPPSSKKASRRWIPAVALISGPMLTFGWCVVDACYISPSYYIHPEDFTATAVPAVFVGLVAGVIGATAFWIAERSHSEN